MLFKRIANNQAGMSLIELVIALSIFGIIMIIATDSFLNVIRASRESVNVQNLQDHTRFLYEMMLKEIKFARINNDSTCASFDMANKVYKVDSNSLYFRNNKGQCVTYRLDDSNPSTPRLKIRRDGSDFVDVFPTGINVSAIDFDVVNLVNYSIDKVQHFPPSVSLSMELSSDMWQEPVLQVQSTVTSRYIE